MKQENKFEVEVPVLYIAFNRLDIVKRTFTEIQNVKPKELYVAVDGPRNKDEASVVKRVRTYILDNVTWNCKVHTLFPKKNRGCKVAVPAAIDWFFEHVEMGIIIEDDSLAGIDFFRFAQELLYKYKGDKRITSIFGINPISLSEQESYTFHNYIGLWGWASWRRVWQTIYHNEEAYMKRQGPKKYLKEVFPNPLTRVIAGRAYKNSISNNINTWEYPLALGILRRGGLNIIPRVNLVENIGLETTSTNIKPNPIDQKFMAMKRQPIQFPLRHPTVIKQNRTLKLRFMYRDYTRIFLKRLYLLFHMFHKSNN